MGLVGRMWWEGDERTVVMSVFQQADSRSLETACHIYSESSLLTCN